MNPVDGMLLALAAEPGDAAGWLALADALEEDGREREAELTRVRERLRGMPFRAKNRSALEGRLRELLRDGVRAVMPELVLPVSAKVSMAFVLIPPGRFPMGCSPNEGRHYPNQSPRHTVTLTRGFWLGRTTVTNAEWHAAHGTKVRPARKARQPMTGFTWHGAVGYCRRLTAAAGRPVRLPTEAEWEYACRAGTTTPFHSGTTVADAVRAGWHSPQPWSECPVVGQLEPNAWGLYDMHGSVWEWCLDAIRPYGKGDICDPVHELLADTPRALRGGSTQNGAHDARSACRGWGDRSQSAAHWGCRLAVSLADDDPLLAAVRSTPEAQGEGPA